MDLQQITSMVFYQNEIAMACYHMLIYGHNVMERTSTSGKYLRSLEYI